MLERIRQELEQGKSLLVFAFLQATGQALGMITPLVIAKFFLPELFGSYSLARMVVFFFLTLLIVSLQTPFIVFANQEKAKTGKISKSFSVQCGFFSLGVIIFLCLDLIFSRAIMAFAKISAGELLCMSLAFIGLAMETFLCNLFLAMGQRIKSSLAEMVFGVLSLLLIFAFYLAGAINLKAVFLVYFIAACFVAVIFIRAVDFSQLLPLSIDKQHLRDMFNFTKWVMFGATAAYFINWGDNLVLRFFVSMGDIGTYNLAYQVFKGVAMLTFIVNTYFLPFISQHIDNSEKMKGYLFNKRPKIFILGLSGIGVIFVVAPYILRFIYGEVYGESIKVLRVLLVGSVLILYAVLYEVVLNAFKKYKFTQTVNLFQVLLNLLLDLLLVPVMGIIGAAIATVFAYLCRAVAIKVYFEIRLRKLLKL